MVEFLAVYGGWAGWLFNLALLWQVLRNFRIKKYGSGNRWTWFLFVLAHTTFGAHLWAAGVPVAAASQLSGLAFDIVLLAQSYTMEWE